MSLGFELILKKKFWHLRYQFQNPMCLIQVITFIWFSENLTEVEVTENLRFFWVSTPISHLPTRLGDKDIPLAFKAKR